VGAGVTSVEPRAGNLHATLVQQARRAAYKDTVAEVEPVREVAVASADRAADLSQITFQQTQITDVQAAQLAILGRVPVVLGQLTGVLVAMADALDLSGSPAGPGLRALATALSDLAESASQEITETYAQPPMVLPSI
jgi:hypothetical protein